MDWEAYAKFLEELLDCADDSLASEGGVWRNSEWDERGTGFKPFEERVKYYRESFAAEKK